MIHYVVKAKYIKDYKIEVTFEDEKTGIIDLEQVILNDSRTIFQELKDKNIGCGLKGLDFSSG